MRTAAPITSPNTTNPHLLRLDRWIARHGEAMELRHTVGTTTQTIARVNLKGIIRTLSAEQLIGGLSAFNYLIIISPTDLRRAKWPGSRGDINTFKPTGHTPAADNTLPGNTTATNDTIFFRGASKSISMVSPVYDGNECVRLELKVVG